MRRGVHSAESLCSGFFIKYVCTRKVRREKRPPDHKLTARTRKNESKQVGTRSCSQGTIFPLSEPLDSNGLKKGTDREGKVGLDGSSE